MNEDGKLMVIFAKDFFSAVCSSEWFDMLTEDSVRIIVAAFFKYECKTRLETVKVDLAFS